MRRSILLAASTSLFAPAIIQPAYANTLTPLIPDMYAAMDVVSRELVGFVPSAMRAPSVERAAVGQSVSYPVAPEQEAYDIVPSMHIPEPPDNQFDTQFMAITKSRAVPFGITGEEQRGLNTGGPGMLSVQGMFIAQALRVLANEVESDVAAEAARKASRAYGDPSSPLLADDKLTDIAMVRKILDDNGAPGGRSLVLNTLGGARLRSLYNLTRANEAGSTLTLRQGELLDLLGMSVKESGQIRRHTAGTADDATTDAAGYGVGATTINLASVGTGTIVPGDVISFAGDDEQYVVVGGDTNVANGGAVEIAKPGLRQPIPAVASSVTVVGGANNGGAGYAAGVAFSQSALHVALRAPAIPREGDAAADRIILTDPRSGISFEFAIYLGYKKVRYEVGLAWGVHASKSEHIALLLGS